MTLTFAGFRSVCAQIRWPAPLTKWSAPLFFALMVLMIALSPANRVRADIDPASGIDLIRITHPGNAPWAGNGTPGDRAIGRGSVPYEYSIGRFEVTTAQWVEFLNAAMDRAPGNPIPFLTVPGFWGAAQTSPTVPGGRRWIVPEGNAMRPVGNISWRAAAVFCNWLHNGKGNDRNVFMNGAYDLNTFISVGGFTQEQLTHNAGARYWIPTWDEWLKASHFDPNKSNPDGTLGGWWSYSNGTDRQLVPGPPGIGEANYGFVGGEFAIPLGAYATTTQTPWGLLDAAGATSEWTEESVILTSGPRYRVFEGSFWSSADGYAIADCICTEAGGAFSQDTGLFHGLRIASSVPPPSGMLSGLCMAAALSCCRHRRPRR